MRKRKYRKGAVAHVYQQAYNCYILFYTVKDCLAFFTIFSIRARMHNLIILDLCLMPDHIHFVVEAASQAEISAFVNEYSTIYAKEFNSSIERKGPVFRKSYGMANKTNDKAKRTCILYALNNPVEKKLCSAAEKWQWNFLKYAESTHPFSEQPKLSHASKHLRDAMHLAKIRFTENKPLPLQQLENMFSGLSKQESLQLTDYIVRIYNVIDYPRLLSFFGGYEQIVLAANANTGSEYDIKETFNPYSDKAYSKISRFLQESGLRNLHEAVTMPAEEKVRLANEILSKGIATPLQIKKYFHIEQAKSKDERS